MYNMRHYRLFYKDTICVDLHTHLALNLCTHEMGHTKRGKTSEAEKLVESKLKAAEDLKGFSWGCACPSAPFLFYFPSK